MKDNQLLLLVSAEISTAGTADMVSYGYRLPLRGESSYSRLNDASLRKHLLSLLAKAEPRLLEKLANISKTILSLKSRLIETADGAAGHSRKRKA